MRIKATSKKTAVLPAVFCLALTMVTTAAGEPLPDAFLAARGMVRESISRYRWSHASHDCRNGKGEKGYNKVDIARLKLLLKGECADLKGVDLTDAGLANAVLRGANLAGAILDGAYLQQADLTGAVLTGAKLRKSPKTGNIADLRMVVAVMADLRGADLTGADLRRGNFVNADLREAILKETLRRGTNFRMAKVEGAVW